MKIKQTNNQENFDEDKINKTEEVIQEIQSFLSIENLEMQKEIIQKFIEKRLQQLQKECPEKQKTLSLTGSKAEGQFILPDTEIKRSWIVDGFKINDPEIYNVLLQTFGKFYKHWNNPNLRSITGHAITYSLIDYFGNYISTQNTEAKNREFYSDHTTSDSQTINLKELKGKNLAVCAEKASVAHNYLKFLGVDSHIIFSDNCKLGEAEEGHAYIIFSTKNGNFIFDPTNPILVEQSDGKINAINPAIYKISEEDYNHLLNRDNYQVTVQHINQKIEDGKYIPQETQNRIYG